MLRATGHARMVTLVVVIRDTRPQTCVVSRLTLRPKYVSNALWVVGLQPTVIASRAPHLLHDSKNRGRASPVSSGDGARNTFFLLDQAQILSYHVQRTCQPACQSTRCWFIRLSHIRDVIRCVEKQCCCCNFRICTRCTRKAKGSATINHLCNMRRCL